LIQLDLYYRRASGAACLAEDYLDRFPPLDGNWLAGILTAAAAPSGAEDALTTTILPSSRGLPEGVEESYDFLAPSQNPSDLGCLGPYHVLKVLGTGGMGVVFQAYDPHLERLVALKAMLPALAASASARQRFLREAKATAAIKHDHIVTIYQVGEDRGVPFLAMEFLEGEPLDARLGRERWGAAASPLPLREALRISREIADGLDAAHQRGLIHRDVKPANVWLEGDRRRVKILDFGLARAVADNANLTQEGAIVGTPAYMAPEQIAGKPVDARTDLFSLGCVMYRMTTGELPFKGIGAISTFLAISTETPALPRERNPALPAAASDLVMRLLAKNANDRPASARAVVEAIQAIEKTLATSQGDSSGITALGFDANVKADDRDKSTAVMPAVATGRPATFRRLWPRFAAAVLLILAVYWCGPAVVRYATDKGELVIEIDDPEVKVIIDQQKGVTIRDKAHEGAEFLLKPGRHDLTAGDYEIEVTEVGGGVHLFTKEFTVTRGGVTSVKVTFDPANVVQKRRDDAMYSSLGMGAAEKVLRKLLGKEVDPKANLDQLRLAVAEFRQKRAGAPQALESAKLLERLPSPLDVLDREKISPYELSVAGGGDPKAAPKELAAVLGDSRLRHVSWADSVVFSPNGKKLISGSGDGTVKVWDTASGEALQTIVWGKTARPTLSPDGRTLAVWGDRPEVLLWDLETGKPGRTLLGHTDGIGLAVFSHDGKTLATSSADGSVKLWEVATGTVRRTLLGRKEGFFTLAFSPGDKILTGSCYMERNVRILLEWDVTGEGGPRETTPTGGRVGAISSDGKRMATIYEDDLSVKVLDAVTGMETLVLQGSKHLTRCVTFSPNGHMLASGGRDGELKVWNLDTGKLYQDLSYSYRCSVLCLAFSADGRLLASAGDDRRVRLWDVNTGKEHVPLKPGCGYLAAVGPDGRTLTTLEDGHKIKILDMATGQEGQKLLGSNFTGFLALSPDGRSVVALNWYGPIQLWNLATAEPQTVGTHPTGLLQALVVSPDGALAASAVGGAEVKLWDLAAKRQVRTFTHMGQVRSLAFSPDGRMLAAATADKVVKVWSTVDGWEQRTLLGSCVAFSPDGSLAVAGGDTVTLYDAVTWKEIRTLHRKSTEPVEPFSLVFNPSGSLVAASNDDGKVVVWNLNDDKAAPRTFWVCRPRHAEGQLAFTPEGRYLISANANGTTYILRLTAAPTPDKADKER
jgi:WD40 repeat protein/predicted Ser/Thr protein kinase